MSAVSAPFIHVRKHARAFAGARRVRLVRRWALLALGFVLIAVGLVGAVLPGHLGLPVVIVGLAVVLRNSRNARRRFVRMQHRHPRWVFPLRRLLRSPREIIPVMWQSMLRTERFVLRRWAFLGRARRRLLRRHRFR